MKRYTELTQLPPPVQKFETYLQELWMGVFNDAVENTKDNPDARAYRAVEWYMTHREMDEERSLLMRVITPGKVQASTGEHNWTQGKQNQLLKSAEKARANGILPAIWYGDHDNKHTIGWGVEVWEEEYNGKPWVYIRPLITDEHVRAQMYDGTLKYLSAEIFPEIEMHRQTFKEMLTGVVVLDPAQIPDTYPAVPDSGVLIASAGAVINQDKMCLLSAGVEVRERSTKVEKENKTEMTVDDVLGAVNKIATSIEGLSGTMESVKTSVGENSQKLSAMDDRLSAIEKGVEPSEEVKEEEIASEVKASLDELSKEPDKFLACLGAGGRKVIEEGLCGVKDEGSRTALLSIISTLPKVDTTEQTNAMEHGPTEDAEKLKFSVTPKDDMEKANLRAASVLKFRAEVDEAKLSATSTIQEEAQKLSQAAHPHLW